MTFPTAPRLTNDILSNQQAMINWMGTAYKELIVNRDVVEVNINATLPLQYTPGTRVLNISTSGATSGQVLGFNGTAWVPTTLGTGGDVVGPSSATINAIPRFQNIIGKEIKDSPVLISDTGNMTGINNITVGGALAHSGTTAGFFNTTPVTKPSSYTQTYATADKTIGAYTSDTESVAYTGIDNLQIGTVYATVADLNALRTAYETLRVFAEDIGQALNALIDDHQSLGLA